MFDEDITSFRSGITVGDDGWFSKRSTPSASSSTSLFPIESPLTAFLTGDIDNTPLLFFFVGSTFAHSSSSSSFSFFSALLGRPPALDASSKYFGNFAPKFFATLAPSVNILLSSFVNMSGSSMRSNFFSIDSICIFFTRSRKSSSFDGSSSNSSSFSSSFSSTSSSVISSFTFKAGVLNTSSSFSSAARSPASSTKISSFTNINST